MFLLFSESTACISRAVALSVKSGEMKNCAKRSKAPGGDGMGSEGWEREGGGVCVTKCFTCGGLKPHVRVRVRVNRAARTFDFYLLF